MSVTGIAAVLHGNTPALDAPPLRVALPHLDVGPRDVVRVGDGSSLEDGATLKVVGAFAEEAAPVDGASTELPATPATKADHSDESLIIGQRRIARSGISKWATTLPSASTM